ncbi:hypothetical protein BASA50_005267 [Batrachochytrium salamandrivorans]|uniref:Transmembrane protein n=1 Tax=Batrachochytrium salamandrivorans TaxID=1357716 RepID=A0ABQ8FD68_9FUNG|nr:hypothetical protein BASA60_009667 [Batrachochytrium salamandrivorans]KAH6577923.1 hypothetical protein BASA62_000631 [Batrachochytrium salamandrivorans]KAH6589850.1 hypothetical protein BASA61_005493 [Batrachochytrium salamandrivorans]KAH6596225.1 hypothetical protein BASA50_005267 [Batrachochytrium salamandrivorans]KAH6598420.1 hypothetical protein BASA61_002851 [Batrachochytrium salamandrivorans]
MRLFSREATHSLLTKKSNWPSLAVGLSLVQAVVITVLESFLIYKVTWHLDLAFSQATSGYAPFVVVYLSLFVLALWFQVYGALDAYYHRNSIQVIAVTLFNAVTVIYSISQIVQITTLKSCLVTYAAIFPNNGTVPPNAYHDVYNLEQDTSRTCRFSSVKVVNSSLTPTYTPVSVNFTPEVISMNINNTLGEFESAVLIGYGIVVVMTICNLMGLFLSFKTFGVYGWSIYQIQGADIVKREILRRYYIFATTMKFNVFFFFGIISQLGFAAYFKNKVATVNSLDSDGLLHDNLEKNRIYLWGFGTIALITSIFYFVLGYLGMRRASYSLMCLFLVMMAAYIVAVFYFLIQANSDPDLSVTKIWLTVFAGFQILLNLITLISAISSMRDFSKGLREIVQSVIVVNQSIVTDEMRATEHARMILD